MQLLCALLALAVLASPAHSQAPGDSDTVCTVTLAELHPVYPNNMKVLMDSADYQNLIAMDTTTPGPVWQTVDVDNIDTMAVRVSWTETLSFGCLHHLEVCGFTDPDQDNWLITQHINRTLPGGDRLEQVEVTIDYHFVGCTSGMCSASFKVYKYDTSVIDSAAAGIVSNFGGLPVAVVAPTDQLGGVQNQTISLTYTSTDTDSGFYLAIRDQNSCLTISRVLVFYYVCPAEVRNFVQFEEHLAPPNIPQDEAVSVTAQCVPTASPVSETGEVRVICGEGGVWQVIPGFGCECDFGTQPNSDGSACIGSTLPPRLITTPEPAYAPQDTNATFTCSGSSSVPGFSIFWLRNRIPLSSNELDGIIFTVTRNGSVVSSELTVLVSVEDDGDNFTCVLPAISGILISEPARLNTFRFLTPMPSEAALGTNTTFFCKGIGSVDFRITWQRNGIQFDSNELSSDGIVYDITRGGRLESSLLTVLASPGNDGASFTCVLVIPNITAFLSDPARITVRRVRVSFVPPFGRSVFEGVADGAVEVCLNVTGRFSGGRNLSVTVVGRPNQMAPTAEVRADLEQSGVQCHTIAGVVIRDGLVREAGQAAVFLLSNSDAVVITQPSFIIFNVIDEDIALLKFTRPFFEVSESEGLDGVCVRLELPRGGAMSQPVTFRTLVRQLGDKRGRNFSRGFFMPLIGYFHIGARTGDMWCLPASLSGDEGVEPSRRLQVELFASNVNVVPVRRRVNLTIIRDSTPSPSPTPGPTLGPTPGPLEAYFTGGTPRVEGDRLILMVNTSRPAAVICRINRTTTADCTPQPGQRTTISPIFPGTYSVRAIATTTDERVVVESISVVVPQEDGCSAHLINRGVTVQGRSARVEFSGIGLGDRAAFVCRLNNGQDQPCTSPLALTDLGPRSQRVRIAPLCSNPVPTVIRFTI